MNIRRQLLAAALAATLIGTALAQSQPPQAQSKQSRPDRAMGPERMFEGLDVTEAQRTQLRTIADEHRNATAPLRERMRAAQQTLANARPGDPDYEAKTAEARRTLQETREQARDEMGKFRTRADAVFTPEQRTQVEARRTERRERMGERRGQRGGMEGRGGRLGHGAGGRPRRGGG